MKKSLSIFAAVAAMILAVGCQKKDPIQLVQVQLMTEGTAFEVGGVAVKMTDASATVYESTTNPSGLAEFNVPTGLYTVECVFKEVINGIAISYSASESFNVAVGARNLCELKLNAVERQQIIIKELYCMAVPTNDGAKTYANDAYVTLYNNSDAVADASNLVIGVLQPGNAHATNKYVTDGKLIYEDAGWVPAYSALWHFNNPVEIEPYSSITIAIFGAIDHTATVSQSVDLSKSEYYVMAKDGCAQITNAKYQIAETIPTSHYMSAYMFNAGNAWVLSNTSPAFFIANMNDVNLKALVDDTAAYDTTGGTTNVGWAPKFPVSCIIDAIDVWESSNIEKSVHRFPAVVNNGHATITSKLGHTLYRCIDKEATMALPENADKLVNAPVGVNSDPSGIDAELSMANGAHIIFSDTNNSGVDFYEREKSALRK